MSVLVLALFLALVQLALALHIRNTLVSAAGEGARFAAASNADPAAGVAHTRALVRQALPDSYHVTVTPGVESVDGVPIVVMTVRGDLPVFGWLGPSGGISVSGHAMEES